MSILSALGLTSKATALEQQYGLPSGLLDKQVQAEGGVTVNSDGSYTNNYSSTGAFGLAQVLPGTAAQPGFQTSPITMQQAADPSQALTFMAQYDAGRIAAAGGDVNAGLSGYSGGGYNASTLGVLSGTGSNANTGTPSSSGSNLVATASSGLTAGQIIAGGGSSNGDGTFTTSDGQIVTPTLTITPQATPGGANDVQAPTTNAVTPSSDTTGIAGTIGTLLGTNTSTGVSGIIAQAENYMSDLFVRGAVIILGVIFVGVGLALFGKNTSPGKIIIKTTKNALAS